MDVRGFFLLGDGAVVPAVSGVVVVHPGVDGAVLGVVIKGVGATTTWVVRAGFWGFRT